VNLVGGNLNLKSPVVFKNVRGGGIKKNKEFLCKTSYDFIFLVYLKNK